MSALLIGIALLALTRTQSTGKQTLPGNTGEYVPPVDTADPITIVKKYHPWKLVIMPPLVMDTDKPVPFSNMNDPNKYYVSVYKSKSPPFSEDYVYRGSPGDNIAYRIEPYRPDNWRPVA